MSDTLETLRLLYGNPMEVFASNLRGVIIPNDGNAFFCGDYAAIEVRVLFWMAGHTEGLKVYEENRDLYREMATKVYGVRLEDVTKDQREIGKRVVLGCGFGMGHKKFTETCKQFGIELEPTLSEKAVKAYRETHTPVPEFWQELNTAAINACKHYGSEFKAGKTKWKCERGYLWCELPSGRKLAYYQPEIRWEDTPWGKKTPRLYYKAVNSLTKQWGSEATYGGKICENVVQATARDLMAFAMLRLEDAGFEVRLSVHDELLCEASKHRELKDFKTGMELRPTWADGLPVKVDAWCGERYRK